MPKRLLALNLLLAAIAVVFSAQLIRVLSTQRSFPPPFVPPAVQALASSKDEPAPPRPSLAAYGVVATRNLFNPNRSEVVAKAPLAPSAKPVLHGVVINEGVRVAYLEDPLTKRVFGYKIGDTVGGGQLDRIEADRVVIKRPEGPLEVKLKDPTKPKPVAVAPRPFPGVTPQPTVPSGVAPIPSITPSAPGVPPPGAPGGPRPPRAPRPQQGVGAPGAPAPSP